MVAQAQMKEAGREEEEHNMVVHEDAGGSGKQEYEDTEEVTQWRSTKLRKKRLSGDVASR